MFSTLNLKNFEVASLFISTWNPRVRRKKIKLWKFTPAFLWTYQWFARRFQFLFYILYLHSILRLIYLHRILRFTYLLHQIRSLSSICDKWSKYWLSFLIFISLALDSGESLALSLIWMASFHLFGILPSPNCHFVMKKKMNYHFYWVSYIFSMFTTSMICPPILDFIFFNCKMKACKYIFFLSKGLRDRFTKRKNQIVACVTYKYPFLFKLFSRWKRVHFVR